MFRIGGILVAGLIAAVAAVSGTQPATGATTVQVCGSGYGHGVGMSQWGAYGRAKAGQGYTQILRTYYPGAGVQRFADDPLVRVLLSDKPVSGYYQYVAVPTGTRAVLRNLATGGTVALGPGTYRVQYFIDRNLYQVANATLNKNIGAFRGPIQFEPASGGTLGVGGKAYRGVLVVQVANYRLYLINQLPMELYIRGVVPNEMPTSWAPEALKSQAVAARSYARATLRSGVFNLYADTRDQVYGGASAETAATNNAVAATARTYVTYGGKPIKAFFSSAAGGYTEDSSYVFGGSVPYLKAVRDVDSWGRPFEGAAYARSPWIGWKGTLNPYGSPQFGVGSITGVRVLQRSPSGRVTSVEVTGTQGKKTISGEYNIRFGLKSAGLTRADGSRYPAGALPSAKVYFGAVCN